MTEIGSGSGTSYPRSIDTDASPETTTTYARADVPNDLAACVIAIQTELGINPAGSVADVVTRLDILQNTDGTLKITGETHGAILYYSTSAWTIATISALLPAGTHGALMYYSTTAWQYLEQGATGTYLKSQGTGTSLTWAAVTGLPSGTHGALMYYSTSAWQYLEQGTNGQYLKSQGTGTSLAWDTPAGGAGKAFIELLPQDAGFPNSNFARLDKISSTGVWNIIKFEADGSAASDEVAYFQKQVPAFYAGGNWIAQVQSKTEDTNTAHFAKLIIEGRAIANGEVWNGSFSTLCAITINAGNTATLLLIDTATVSSNLPSASEMWHLKVYVDRSGSDLDVGNKELRTLSITLEEV